MSAAAAFAAAGCASADENGVRDTIEALERALRAGDAPGVCRLYDGDQPFCRAHFGPAELGSIRFGGEIEVLEVSLDGDEAMARVENLRAGRRVRGSARLRKVDDEWLLVPPGTR